MPQVITYDEAGFPDGYAEVGAGTGDVTGPLVSTPTAIALWADASGNVLADSLWTIAPDGKMFAAPTNVIGDALRIDVNAITSGNGIVVYSNSVTAGTLLQIINDSPDPTIRSVGRFDQTLAAAAQCIGLYIGQAAPFVGLWLDQTNDGNAIRIPNAQNLTENVIQVNADLLTTGGLARFASASPSALARNLWSVVQSNALAVNARTAYIEQASDADGLLIAHSANGRSLHVFGPGVTTNALISALGDALTTGGLESLISNSADPSPRSLSYIANANALAVGAVVKRLVQAAPATPTLAIQAAAGGGVSSTAETFFYDRSIRFRQDVGDGGDDGVIAYRGFGTELDVIGVGGAVAGNRLVMLWDGVIAPTMASMPGGVPPAGRAGWFMNASGRLVNVDSGGGTHSFNTTQNSIGTTDQTIVGAAEVALGELSNTVTVAAGETVNIWATIGHVMLAAAAGTIFRFYRGATNIASFSYEAAAAGQSSAFTMTWRDTPGAGVHTYTVNASVPAGSTTRFNAATNFLEQRILTTEVMRG